ncbi:MAG: 4Fe-4S dicluster domain-containing protein [bacterium]|nr:4Fe-4S dicluster domain-containing protein [bacterium]
MRGGLMLLHDHPWSKDERLQDLPAPPRLLLPLVQGRPTQERPLEPCVDPGETVSFGQPIALPEANGARGVPLHAPADAVAGPVVSVDTPYGEGLPALELESCADQMPRRAELPDELPDVGAERLDQMLHAAGIGGPDWATADGSTTSSWLIVNGLESEPGQTVMRCCLIEHAAEVLRLTAWLSEMLSARRICLVAESGPTRTPGGATALRRVARRMVGSAARGVRVVGLRNKYPQSFEPLIVQAVTGREVPFDGKATDLGVRVVDVRTLLDIGQAIISGRPKTHLLITVTGDAVGRPGNYRVPLGVTVGDVARAARVSGAATVVADNILAGPAVRRADTVLTKHTRMLLFGHSRRREPRLPTGCIRCGWCLDHCPVGIEPRSLLDLVERRRLDLTARFAPGACVDCGLCDYVCPSGLPLMRAVQRSRGYVLGT